MATLLTGRYPKDHGATHFYSHLDSGLPTLASILAARGFDTRAFVSHILLTPEYGFRKGFAQYDTSVLSRGIPRDVSTAKQITDLALGGIRVAKEPFFIWAHYFEPHFAYLRHEPWSEFGDTAKGRYDQEIAFTDRQIGRLLAQLRETGLMERTIVVFTSDHGEEFAEHGGEYHYTLYDEIVRVPLVISAPGLAPGIRNVPAQQVDLLPTLLALLDIEGPNELPGVDLLGPVDADRAIFIERDRPAGYRQRAIIRGDKKLLRIERVDQGSLPQANRRTFTPVENVRPGTYLFDRSVDPGEQQSAFDEADPESIALLAELAAHSVGAVAATKSVEVDEKMREELRALGYLQ